MDLASAARADGGQAPASSLRSLFCMSEMDEDRLFVVKVGPLAIDIPRTVGFYGGIALAVGLDMIAPPLACAIAAVPLLKLLKRKNATLPEKVVAAVVEGAANPVGGDAEGCVRSRKDQEEKEKRAHASKNPPGGDANEAHAH
jgi:hypothetical protein